MVLDKLKGLFKPGWLKPLWNPSGSYVYRAGGRTAAAAQQEKGFRYPAPGMDVSSKVPTGPEDRLYDITYYSRDTRRNAPTHKAALVTNPEMAPQLALGEETVYAAAEETGSGASGQKNPDVLRYDPKGLRAAMTATWDETHREIQRHMPTQLTRTAWQHEQRDILAKCAADGTPPVPGRPKKWGNRRTDYVW